MPRVLKNILSQAVCLLILSVSAGAYAQASSAEIAVARRLFKEAVDLEAKGRWPEAAQTLREALAIKDTAGLRFHLANAEVEQGHLVEALVEYDRADELIASGEVAPDVQELLVPARDELKKRVPTVHVVGLASDAGVSLMIDGRLVASSLLAHPIPLNPGPHKLVVQSAGSQRAVFEVELREGERRQIHVQLAPEFPKAQVRQSSVNESLIAGSSAETSRGRAPRSSSTARTVVVVSEVVLTAAGLGVGAGFLLKQSAIDDRAGALNRELAALSPSAPSSSVCGAPPDAEAEAKCSDFRVALVDSKQARDIAIAGFLGAGVAAVTTVITLIVWDTDAAANARAPQPRMWSAALAPLADAGIGATFAARW